MRSLLCSKELKLRDSCLFLGTTHPSFRRQHVGGKRGLECQRKNWKARLAQGCDKWGRRKLLLGLQHVPLLSGLYCLLEKNCELLQGMQMPPDPGPGGAEQEQRPWEQAGLDSDCCLCLVRASTDKSLLSVISSSVLWVTILVSQSYDGDEKGLRRKCVESRWHSTYSQRVCRIVSLVPSFSASTEH